MTAERILEAARVLFAARGYRATSMQAIADEVGLTKAALYYHFEPKDEILRQLTLPLLDELEAVLAEAESCENAEEAARFGVSRATIYRHLKN
ncbi:TetR family transcriptional regulator [Nonomuraea rubra]